MRRLALSLSLLAACQSAAPVARTFNAPAERVATAVRAALEEGGNVESKDGILETYWRRDDAVRSAWTGSGTAAGGESRYRVTVDGPSVSIEARSRVFVNRGTRRRDWEDVDPGAAAARLLQRIEARLVEAPPK